MQCSPGASWQLRRQVDSKKKLRALESRNKHLLEQNKKLRVAGFNLGMDQGKLQVCGNTFFPHRGLHKFTNYYY